MHFASDNILDHSHCLCIRPPPIFGKHTMATCSGEVSCKIFDWIFDTLTHAEYLSHTFAYICTAITRDTHSNPEGEHAFVIRMYTTWMDSEHH